ncbi:DUF6049 family protein [Planobispora takensis]|uniref:Secreted protein n=1 Tax=Planobispora takensis TaxID=1367882 RepID=A0A8J3SSF6_9ACTN|nr:DUF6049 family protein [Planobispora takensis]GIH98022.1 hypothetical protein Pta02_00310 [Planobispora takensis]
MIRKAAALAVLTATLLFPAAVALPGSASAQTNAAGTVTGTAERQSRQTTHVVIESIGPEVAREPADEIKVSGSVVNSGTETLNGLRTRMHYSSQPFAQRAQMAVYLTGQGFQPGAWQTERYLPQPVPAGGEAAWEYTFTPGALGISRFGVYPLMIEVIDSLGRQVAVQRTFITYMPRDLKVPRTRLSVVLPLIDQPRRADDGTFLDESLPASLTSGKRLGDLLKLAQDTSSFEGLTWMVDPALLDDARAMGGTHWSRSEGRGRSRPGDTATAQWLDDLRSALAEVPVVAVPYADPDVAALAHNGLDDVTGTGVTTAGKVAEEILGRDVPTDVGWPVDGMIDYDGLDLLASAGVRTVLLDAVNLPAQVSPAAVTTPTGTTTAAAPVTTPDAVATVHSVNGPVKALVADAVLSETLGAVTSAPGAAQLNRQRFVAETAMISAEPVTEPRTVVVVPPRRWSPDPAYVSGLLETASRLPWLSPTPLDKVRPAKVATARGDLAYAEQDRREELGKQYLGSVRRVGARADLTAAVTVAEDFDAFDMALLRLSSSAWRDRTEVAKPYVERVQETIDAHIAKVWITGSELSQIRTLAGTDGEVPISVRNELKSDRGVRVRVKVTSQAPKLLKIEPYKDEMIIFSDQIETIRIPMTSKGSGQATVTVQLTTDDGRKYGQKVKLTVRTTGYTGIALVIVGAALVVMLAAVVMRVLRRRGARRVAAAVPARQSAVPAGNES